RKSFGPRNAIVVGCASPVTAVRTARFESKTTGEACAATSAVHRRGATIRQKLSVAIVIATRMRVKVIRIPSFRMRPRGNSDAELERRVVVRKRDARRRKMREAIKAGLRRA